MGAITAAYGDSPIVHPSPAFNQIVTWLGWLKRLPIAIEPVKDSQARYWECEKRIQSIDFDTCKYVPILRRIWEEWFAKFTLSHPFRPRHGSGSTADAGPIAAEKWRRLGVDTAARVCLHPYWGMEYTRNVSTSRTNKLVYVPKQAGRNRAICMEPAWLQYLQQGVADQLIRYTHRNCHPLSGLVNIRDQDINRTLCADAYWHELSTIDLSDASDSISVRLIKRLTEGMPLWKYLYGTRSTSVLMDGKVSPIDKFAPMGSALCFPIESYLFSSIVEAAYRRYYDHPSKGSLSGCSVYGDDLIVPREIYHLVTGMLTALGFEVNHDKSFYRGNYFESCGVEFCRGRRIYSVRHPRRHLVFPNEVGSPGDISMVTDIANALLDFGAFGARRSLLKYVERCSLRVGSKTKPFKDFLVYGYGDGVIHTLYDSEDVTTWNSSLQRYDVSRPSVRVAFSDSVYDFTERSSSEPHPPTREERLAASRTYFKPRKVHEKWSDKAISILLKQGQYDLLEHGEIESIGARRTGKMHFRIQYQRCIPEEHSPGVEAHLLACGS